MTMMKCNVHLSTWLYAGKLTKRDRDTLVNLYDLNPHHLLSTGSIKVRFDYPLGHPVEFESGPGPIAITDFITFVAKTYAQIYREEDETSKVPAGQAAPHLLNRNTTDGRYGIWGHSMGDLYLEGFELGKDGTWTLLMGS